MFSLDSASVFSSLAFLPAAGVLLRKGHVHVFWPEVLAILIATFASTVYHACVTSVEHTWCPDVSPSVSLARDTMAAYLALNAAVCPLLHQWAPHPNFRALYGIVVGLATYVLVVMYQDGLEPVIALACTHGLTLLYLGYRNVSALGPWRKQSGVGAVLALVAAVTLRVLSRREYTDDTPQPDLYHQLHASWHVCGGLAAFFFFLMLDSTHEYTLVKKEEAVQMA